MTLSISSIGTFFRQIINRRYISIFIVSILFLSFLSLPCQAQHVKQPHSILLLIDVSGSMTGTKIDSVKSAAKQIISMLLPCNTEFGVMGFSGKKENPVPFQMDFSTNAFELLSFIDKLKPEGGTLLGTALKKACYSFASHKGNKDADRTIILLGDGKSDDNVPSALKELRERNALIQCECIGFDIEKDPLAESQLKQIANETGGEYYVATDVTNVVKAFQKTIIKTIIADVPVKVRKRSGAVNLQLSKGNIYNMLTSQNWILDSVQVNVPENLFELAQLIAEEDIQDTLPKSLVFENTKKLSLFLNNGTDNDPQKKWVEGTYTFTNGALAINVKHYYFNLIVKKLDSQSLVLCVNKFTNTKAFMGAENPVLCDCGNKFSETSPYILIYFSKVVGCR